MTQRTSALVFAQGGPEKPPGKNIEDLGGHPLLAHSIRLAKALNRVEGALVSIGAQSAVVATQFGTDVIARPAALALALALLDA
jgi:CMP-N,N'-diacetyllegionaminic acid synthase